MLARAELVAVPDRLVGGRPYLVRAPRREQVLLPVGHAHVRPEELVRRAEKNIDVPVGHIDGAVWAVVDGVSPRESSNAVSQLDDAPDVGGGADRVRGDREGDDARPIAELGREAVVVE